MPTYDLRIPSNRKAVVNRLVFERIAHRFVRADGSFNCLSCAEAMETSPVSVARLAKAAGYDVRRLVQTNEMGEWDSALYVRPVTSLFRNEAGRRHEAPIAMGYDYE